MNSIEELKIKQIKRSYTIVLVILLIIMGMILACYLYLKSFSPTYLFINDTEFQVHTYLSGSSSPIVRLNIVPGERRFVHWSWVSGQLDLPFGSDGQRVQPKYDLIVFKVFYISDFPSDWLD